MMTQLWFTTTQPLDTIMRSRIAQTGKTFHWQKYKRDNFFFSIQILKTIKLRLGAQVLISPTRLYTVNGPFTISHKRYGCKIDCKPKRVYFKVRFLTSTLLGKETASFWVPGESNSICLYCLYRRALCSYLTQNNHIDSKCLGSYYYAVSKKTSKQTPHPNPGNITIKSLNYGYKNTESKHWALVCARVYPAVYWHAMQQDCL